MFVLTDKGPNKINTQPSSKDFSKNENEREGGACMHVCADHRSTLDAGTICPLSLELTHLTQAGRPASPEDLPDSTTHIILHPNLLEARDQIHVRALFKKQP